MKREEFSVKCPKHIVFGDPMYFETLSKEKRKDLVVDCKIPKGFETLVALEEEMVEGYETRTMHIYIAPVGEAWVYAEGMCYESQEQKQRPIVVDTAEYMFQVDGRTDIFHTAGDGYWGSYFQLYDKPDKAHRHDAVIISVYMPDNEDFSSMKQRMGYFFEDVKPWKKASKREKHEKSR